MNFERDFQGLWQWLWHLSETVWLRARPWSIVNSPRKVLVCLRKQTNQMANQMFFPRLHNTNFAPFLPYSIFKGGSCSQLLECWPRSRHCSKDQADCLISSAHWGWLYHLSFTAMGLRLGAQVLTASKLQGWDLDQSGSKAGTFNQYITLPLVNASNIQKDHLFLKCGLWSVYSLKEEGEQITPVSLLW